MVKILGNDRGLFSSLSSEWETPAELFEELDKEFRFTVDVFDSPGNTKCAVYLSSEDAVSALVLHWTGICWMNPPYGRQIGRWVHKARLSAQAGATVVCLLPSRTDTRWWHNDVMKAAEIRFIQGRLYFERDGKQLGRSPFPSAIVIFRP